PGRSPYGPTQPATGGPPDRDPATFTQSGGGTGPAGSNAASRASRPQLAALAARILRANQPTRPGRGPFLLDGLFGMFSRDIGIDLRTATTLVHVRRRGIVISDPSVLDKA